MLLRIEMEYNPMESGSISDVTMPIQVQKTKSLLSSWDNDQGNIQKDGMH